MLTSSSALEDDPTSPRGHITNAVCTQPNNAQTKSDSPSENDKIEELGSPNSDGFHDPLINPKIKMSDGLNNETEVSGKNQGKSQEAEADSTTRIFGGLVTFDQVKRGLLGRDYCMPRRILQERVIPMKGPGGEGTAEVFTSIEAEQTSPKPPSNPYLDEPSANQKRLDFMRRSFRSARDLLWGSAENEATVLDVTDESKLKFSCSLMTLTLPVTVVACKVLDS